MGGAGESRAFVPLPFAIAGIHPAIGHRYYITHPGVGNIVSMDRCCASPESVGTLYPDLLPTRLPRALEKLSRSRENVTSVREEEGWR